jgi:hypothetical protein
MDKHDIQAKIISFILVCSISLTGIPVWTDTAGQPVIDQKPIIDIYIPEQYGSIETLGQGSRGKGQKGQVVLIKDAHCNYEAQTNIAKILEILVREYGVSLVAVEGASGELDLSDYGRITDGDFEKEAVDSFVKKGYVSGPEYLNITKYGKLPFGIYGIEDEKLYVENFISFRKTWENVTETKYFVEEVEGICGRLKEKIFSKELLDFDKKAVEYTNNKMSLMDWTTLLKERVTNDKIQMTNEAQAPNTENKNKNFNLVLRSIQIEKSIDFKKVEEERTDLIKELEKLLAKEDLKELVQKSLLFKLGKISTVEYYAFLEKSINTFNLRFTTSNLRRYIHLVKLQSKTDSDKLFNEIDDITCAIKEDMFKNEIERELDSLWHNVRILKKLFCLEMTRKEFEYLDKNRNKFFADKLISFIKIQCGICGIEMPPALTDRDFVKKVNDSILPSRRFYEYAIERDKILVQNTLKQMEETGNNIAVMVIGGFHKDGIRRLLEDKGVNCFVVTPSITKEQEDNTYLSIMLNKRLFAGAMDVEGGALAAVDLVAGGNRLVDIIRGAREMHEEIREELLSKIQRWHEGKIQDKDFRREFLEAIEGLDEKQYGGLAGRLLAELKGIPKGETVGEQNIPSAVKESSGRRAVMPWLKAYILKRIDTGRGLWYLIAERFFKKGNRISDEYDKSIGPLTENIGAGLSYIALMLVIDVITGNIFISSFVSYLLVSLLFGLLHFEKENVGLRFLAGLLVFLPFLASVFLFPVFGGLAVFGIGVTSFAIAFFLHYFWNVKIDGLIGMQLDKFLEKEGEIEIGALVSLQTKKGEPCNGGMYILKGILSKIKTLINFWNHNISNFIIRQFAEYERGIVELVANGLDAGDENGVLVNVEDGSIEITNGGKGIMEEEVFRNLFIPTYSTKGIDKGTIGRFGVGFLSALNYLEDESDYMEIVSVRNGLGFRMRFGVKTEGAGRAKRKVIVLKEIERQLSEEETKIVNGTKIRIYSRKLNNPLEVEKIKSSVRYRFEYWEGQSIKLNHKEEKEEIGHNSAAYRAIDQGAERGPDSKNQLRCEYKTKEGGVAPAEEPGHGKLIIVLQGVMLETFNIPGVNVPSELIIRLPQNTLIPTSRDKVILDESIIEKIRIAAQAAADSSDLSIRDKIAILNSLQYFLSWVGKTKKSLIVGKEDMLKSIMRELIQREAERQTENEYVLCFVPDSREAYDFFGSTEGVFYINPKLLNDITFAGKRPEKIGLKDANGLEIIRFSTVNDKPVVRLGNYVFIKENEGIDEEDVIWRLIARSIIYNFYEQMTALLSSVRDPRFEPLGRFSPLDEYETKKIALKTFIQAKIAGLDFEIKMIEIKDTVLGEEKGKIERLSRDKASFEKVLIMLERDDRSFTGLLFEIFKDDIRGQGGSVVRKLFSDDAVMQTPIVQMFSRNDLGLFLDSEIGSIIKEPVAVEEREPISTRREKTAAEKAGMLSSLLSLREDEERPKEATVIKKAEGLDQRDQDFFVFIQFMIKWSEAAGEKTERFVSDLFSNPENKAKLAEVFRIVTHFFRSMEELMEANESRVNQLIAFLNTFITGEAVGKGEAEVREKTCVPQDARRQIRTVGLSSLLKAFFRKGADIDLGEIEREDRNELRNKASVGQIQQSVNYQDPEEYVFLRELLQNSRDAIEESEVEAGRRKIEIRTRLVKDGDSVRLEATVADPVGMSLHRVLNYLLIPNRSSKEGMDLTGFFGHGFFTTLTESEEVIVKTSDGAANKTIYVRLVPVRDEETGIVEDVKLDIYTQDEDLKGTEITWRKRGDATVVDLMFIESKVKTFARTMNGGLVINLNGNTVPRLDRERFALSSFESGMGNVSCFADKNNPSIVVQQGLFVTRFDRQFIESVLGIDSKNRLYEIFIKLMEMGIVFELPANISLTRDRGHFVREDIDADTRDTILACLFDSAVKCILADEISLPEGFSYDILTDMDRQRQDLDEPVRLGGIFIFKKEVFDYYASIYIDCIKNGKWRKLFAKLSGDSVSVRRLFKNWLFGPDKKAILQDLLIGARRFTDNLSRQLKESRDRFITSQVFAKIAAKREDLLNETDWEDIKTEIISCIGAEIYDAHKEEVDKLFEHRKQILIQEGFTRENVTSGSIIIFEDIAMMCIRQFIDKEFIDNLRQRDIDPISEIRALSCYGLGTGEVIKRRTYIQDRILENLTKKLFSKVDLETQAVLQSVRQGQEEVRSREDIQEAVREFRKNIETRVERKDPLDTEQFILDIEKYKDRLPQLYYFLLFSQAILELLKKTYTQGEFTDINVGIVNYTQDVSAYHRFGFSRPSVIVWNIKNSIRLINRFMAVLSSPSEVTDESIELLISDFMPQFFEILTHEMIHNSEQTSGDTHNKEFFDKQERLLGMVLNDSNFRKTMRKFLEAMRHDYMDRQKGFDPVDLSGKTAEIIARINNVLRGRDSAGNAMKRMGRREDTGVNLGDREEEFGRLNIIRVVDIGDGRKANVVLTGNLKDKKGRDIAGYNFMDKDGVSYIVINSSMSESIQEEAEFHERREMYWMGKGYNRDNAHVLSSAEGALMYGRDSLTPYHLYLLESMSLKELKALEGEKEEDRILHHKLIEDSGLDVNGVKEYEGRLRREAQSMLLGEVLGLGKETLSRLETQDKEELFAKVIELAEGDEGKIAVLLKQAGIVEKVSAKLGIEIDGGIIEKIALFRTIMRLEEKIQEQRLPRFIMELYEELTEKAKEAGKEDFIKEIIDDLAKLEYSAFLVNYVTLLKQAFSIERDSKLSGLLDRYLRYKKAVLLTRDILSIGRDKEAPAKIINVKEVLKRYIEKREGGTIIADIISRYLIDDSFSDDEETRTAIEKILKIRGTDREGLLNMLEEFRPQEEETAQEKDKMNNMLVKLAVLVLDANRRNTANLSEEIKKQASGDNDCVIYKTGAKVHIARVNKEDELASLSEDVVSDEQAIIELKNYFEVCASKTSVGIEYRSFDRDKEPSDLLPAQVSYLGYQKMFEEINNLKEESEYLRYQDGKKRIFAHDISQLKDSLVKENGRFTVAGYPLLGKMSMIKAVQNSPNAGNLFICGSELSEEEINALIMYFKMYGINLQKEQFTTPEKIRRGENDILIAMLGEGIKDRIPVSSGDRVLIKKDETDGVLEGRIALIISEPHNVNDLAEKQYIEQFKILLKNYYVGTLGEREIDELVRSNLKGIVNGIFEFLLPPVTPFVKTYYDALKGARELIRQSA